MFNNDCDFDYVARFPGTSGYGAAICDDSHPKWKKEIAKTLADWVKRGATVERVPRSVASAGLREFVTSKQGELLPVQANKRYASEAPHNTGKFAKRDKGNEKETRT